MRSSRSIPSNPWPHDMIISVDTPSHLLTLLYVRHAWALAPDADVPRLDPPPVIGSSTLPDTASHREWDGRWSIAWQRAWDRLNADDDDNVVSPPSMWQTDYGPDGIDQAELAAWRVARRDDHSIPLEQHPERRSLDALIQAWRTGINSIIVLPYRGFFARRVARHRLAVSKTTRDDPELYDQALTIATR